MTENERIFAHGHSLWRRVRPNHGDIAAATELDPLELAAYLDGRLDGEARARAEARLAASPALLDLLVASDEALEEGSLAPPESVIRRAGALTEGPEASGRRRRRLTGLLPVPSVPRPLALHRALAFASLAAVFLLAGAAGFELGRAEAAYSAQIGDILTGEVGFAIGASAEDML